MTALADTTAEVFDLNGNLQWACEVTGPFTDWTLGITYYFADFSPFDRPRDVHHQGAGARLGRDRRSRRRSRSAPTCSPVRCTSAMTGIYGQRCGTAVRITIGERHAGSTAPATCTTPIAQVPDRRRRSSKPSTGGWHDAGDYGKYVTNGAFTVGMLLAAWEHFQPTLVGAALAADPGARRRRSPTSSPR